MSKKKDKKKEELPPLPKYPNENMIEELGQKLKVGGNEVDRLTNHWNSMNSEFKQKEQDYIKSTQKITDNLDEKNRENAYLNMEITKNIEEREDFERTCKENFEKKFEEVKAEQRAVIEKVNEEMDKVKQDLDKQRMKKENLEYKKEKLTKEIEKLKNVHEITIQNYEHRIDELHFTHHQKLKQITEIFENFLQNNQELLTTDLFTVYRRLKFKFDSKVKECLDYKAKNEYLKDENRDYRLDMENNDDIIQKCGEIQINNKKKNKELTSELEEKEKLIEQIQMEYSKQFDELNNKYTSIVKDDADEIRVLKMELEAKNKALNEVKQISKEIINDRVDVETFFIDQLKEVKNEIKKKKKNEIEKKKSYFPYINMSYNNQNNTPKDDSIYVTSIKRVDAKDMDPESKEKIIRSILNTINVNKNAKGIQKLRGLLK